MKSSDFGADPSFWHSRFLRQAEWTRELRLHLYRKLEAARCRRILDLGCGTGVIAAELAGRTLSEVHAADRDRKMAAFARHHHQDLRVSWHAADAVELPFRDASFDLIVTHYFWLWAASPLAVLSECQRVLAPGGRLAALCEPDYASRRDEPRELSELNAMMCDNLAAAGADPGIGPKLHGLFESAGFSVISGSMEHAWDNERHREEFENEWEMINAVCDDVRIPGFMKFERQAIEQGKRTSITSVHWCRGGKK